MFPFIVPSPLVVHVLSNASSSDSSSAAMTAWLGLAGVVVGALATGGLNGWLSWLGARRDRYHELDNAISDLQASASTFVVSVNISRQIPAEQRLAMYQSVLVQLLSQVIRASEVIGRATKDRSFAKLADDYADAATNHLDPRDR
jgi:hypothetical protein